jgi:hypothetical protein
MHGQGPASRWHLRARGDRGLRRGNPCVRPCRVGRRLVARRHLPLHSFKTWMGWNSGPPAPTWKQCMVDKFKVRGKKASRDSEWYRRRPVAIAAGPTQPLRPSHRTMIQHSRWAPSSQSEGVTRTGAGGSLKSKIPVDNQEYRGASALQGAALQYCVLRWAML